MTERRRIHAINIRDFRGIDALDLDFTDGTGAPLDVVVLAGANGSGKTSVLEALLIAMGEVDSNYLPVHDQIRFGSKSATIRVSTTAGVLDARLEDKELFCVEQDPRFSYEYFSSERAYSPISAADDTPDHRVLESRRLTELKQRLISTFYRSLRSRNSRAPSIFAQIQNLWQRFDAHGQRIEVIPRDNNPGSGDLVFLCDGGPIPDDVTSFAMARNLAPTRPDIPTMIPLDSLSSGQMALFAFAGPLIFRDEPADIVLIDEPEQHMHVQWQRLLLPALRELCPDTQFIVATHSEEILDSVLSYERFILVDNDDPRARDVEPGAAAE